MDKADPHIPPIVKANVLTPSRIFSCSMNILPMIVFCKTMRPSVITVVPMKPFARARKLVATMKNEINSEAKQKKNSPTRFCGGLTLAI